MGRQKSASAVATVPNSLIILPCTPHNDRGNSSQYRTKTENRHQIHHRSCWLWRTRRRHLSDHVLSSNPSPSSNLSATSSPFPPMLDTFSSVERPLYIVNVKQFDLRRRDTDKTIRPSSRPGVPIDLCLMSIVRNYA